MDSDESKPDIQLLDRQQLKNDSRLAQVVWNCVDDKSTIRESETESLEVKEENEWNGGCESVWDEEKPPVLEAEGSVQWQQNNNSSRESSSSHQASASGTRKRLATALVLSPVEKKQRLLDEIFQRRNESLRLIGSIRDDVVRKFLEAYFDDTEHPSVPRMIELSQTCRISFRKVFEIFEQLRSFTRTPCPIDDPCVRTRTRFGIDTPTAKMMPARPNIRSACLDTFKLLDLRKKSMEETHVHLILENNCTGWHFTPACIRHEWELYRDEMHVINESEFRFHDDEHYFVIDPHPSVEKMIEIATTAGIAYQTVYTRFQELRRAKHKACAENDTCQLIVKFMRYTRSSFHQIDEETNQRIIAEFAKLKTTAIENLPLNIVHLIIQRVQVPCADIRESWFFWRTVQNREKRKRRVSTANAGMTLTERVEDALLNEFKNNPFANVSEINKLSIKYKVVPDLVQTFFHVQRSLMN